MPFDVGRVARRIEALADYYAERAPGLAASAKQGWELLLGLSREVLQMRAADVKQQYVLAYPVESLAPARAIPPYPPAYRVLASDGSSIAPDPTFDVPYAVIHLGVTALDYHPAACRTHYEATLLFEEDELALVTEDGSEVEMEGVVVDTLRAHAELKALWEWAQDQPPDPAGRPVLACMDAILLWRHRGRGRAHQALHKEYIGRSIYLLEQFRQAQVPIISFTSAPHHREVVMTLMAHICSAGVPQDCAHCTHADDERCLTLRDVLDRQLFAYLPQNGRSAVFRAVHQGDEHWRIPEGMHDRDPQLAFFYLKLGDTVARVEFPLWVWEAGLLDFVHGALLDQCRPLRTEDKDYPEVLALAHNEAILRSGDRRAIETLLVEALARRHIFPAHSPKAEMKH